MSRDLIQQCLNSENTEELNEEHAHTHLNFPLWATHLSSSMWYSRCQNTPQLKMNMKMKRKHIWSLSDLGAGGNNGEMRRAKWVPWGGRQIPVLTAVVMVQLRDQSCSSFRRIKLIQIVHLLFHLRHLNVRANTEAWLRMQSPVWDFHYTSLCWWLKYIRIGSSME